jgi:hypothetical protein
MNKIGDLCDHTIQKKADENKTDSESSSWATLLQPQLVKSKLKNFLVSSNIIEAQACHQVKCPGLNSLNHMKNKAHIKFIQ